MKTSLFSKFFCVCFLSVVLTVTSSNAVLWQKEETIRVLVFSKTMGYRHDSIPAAKLAFERAQSIHSMKMDFTEDSDCFSKANLVNYDVIVFLMTTGDVLNESQEKAMESFIREGGGFVGVHSASDTEYDWQWYGELVGAYFLSHPEVQSAKVIIQNPSHATMQSIPNPWLRSDEWYDFRKNPKDRKEIHILATVDETTYRGGKMGDSHPVVWCREFEGGRSWYTAMGHTQESYADSLFIRMIMQGSRWAASKP
jgi:cytochrome c